MSGYTIVFIDGQRGPTGEILYGGRHCYLRKPAGTEVLYGASLAYARSCVEMCYGPVLLFLHFNGPDVRHGIVNDASVDLASRVIERQGRFVWFTGQGNADRSIFRPFHEGFGRQGGTWDVVYYSDEIVLSGIVLPPTLEEVNVDGLPELALIERVPGYRQFVALTENRMSVTASDPFQTMRGLLHRTAYRFLDEQGRVFVDSVLGKADAPAEGYLYKIWSAHKNGAGAGPELLSHGKEELSRFTSIMTQSQRRDLLTRNQGCTCGGVRKL